MEVLKDYQKEFAKLFKPSFNILTNINMKIFFKNESFVGKYWRFLYIIPCVVTNYIFVGFNISKMVAEGQIAETAYLLPPFIISTQAILKFLVLFPKSSLLTSIIQEHGELWRSSELSEAQKKTKDGLLKVLNLCNGLTYWISIIGSGQYLLTPLLENLFRKFILNQDGELLLPIKCSYPFDIQENWFNYIVVYIFQAYSMFLSVCIYIGTEIIMITLCALLGTEFTLLCEDMIKVKPETKSTTVIDLESEENNGIKEKITIKDVVKRHQKLCCLSTQLNKASNQMIFVNLMFVGLTTCFFRYAAQFSPGPTYMINNYVAVLSSLLYVLYLCYYGELLTGASLRIGDMAYHNLWYKGDRQYRKAIFIIIKRSQKPCCLTSMKYTPVSLNMFTKVMSSTWSYLSLMNTVYEEDI